MVDHNRFHRTNSVEILDRTESTDVDQGGSSTLGLIISRSISCLLWTEETSPIAFYTTAASPTSVPVNTYTYGSPTKKRIDIITSTSQCRTTYWKSCSTTEDLYSIFTLY